MYHISTYLYSPSPMSNLYRYIPSIYQQVRDNSSGGYDNRQLSYATYLPISTSYHISSMILRYTTNSQSNLLFISSSTLFPLEILFRYSILRKIERTVERNHVEECREARPPASGGLFAVCRSPHSKERETPRPDHPNQQTFLRAWH